MPSKSAIAEDLAFADTVVATELDGIPSSRRTLAGDESGSRPRVLESSAGVLTTVGFAFHRARQSVQSSRDEIHQLWDAAASVSAKDAPSPYHRPPGTTPVRLSRVRSFGRRVQTLWSFFEWERADLMRAATIGGGTFLVVAAMLALVAFR